MPKRKITEDVRKQLKRQPVQPDVESEAQTETGFSGPNPAGN